MSLRQVVHLPESRLNEAAQALSLAFHDDPLQSYTFPDPDERRRLSPSHFSAILRYGFLAGEVLTGVEPGSGAVVWVPPGVEGTPEMAESAGLTRLAETIGAGAAGRFSRMIDYAEAVHHRDMTAPHWYVMVVGVAPAFQGQGYGRALLQPMLDRAEIEGLPCYLETTQPKNVSFYQRLGFRVLVDGVEPESGLRFWTFRRG
jgi:GNAT superfamily N-acetyltransferase